MINQTTSPATDTLSPKPLEAGLHELLDRDDLYVFGHGTHGKESADAILQDGLHLDNAELWSTVADLGATSNQLDKVEKAKQTIEHWPHRDLKYVVAVGIERLPDDQIPHSRYLQSVVQHRNGAEDIDKQYGARYTVSPRFMAGYFDVAANTFVPNPAFDPEYDVGLLETTADKDINRERSAVPLLELMGSAAVGAEVNSAPLSNDEVVVDPALLW